MRELDLRRWFQMKTVIGAAIMFPHDGLITGAVKAISSWLKGSCVGVYQWCRRATTHAQHGYKRAIEHCYRWCLVLRACIRGSELYGNTSILVASSINASYTYRSSTSNLSMKWFLKVLPTMILKSDGFVRVIFYRAHWDDATVWDFFFISVCFFGTSGPIFN